LEAFPITPSCIAQTVSIDWENIEQQIERGLVRAALKRLATISFEPIPLYIAPCGFLGKAATDSDGRRPSLPIESDHPIRTKAATLLIG
jgi:hypothetical protein